MTTLFSKIIRREIPSHILYDSEEIVAILDINPINEGHILVIPYEEVDDINLLTESRYIQLWKTVKYLSGVLKVAFNAPRVGVAVEGFGVSHAHVHLVPVFSGNELNPERAYKASEGELECAAEKIINELKI